MPIWSNGLLHRPLIRTVGAGWTDCNTWRRNAAGTGWDIVRYGLPAPTSTGSGSTNDYVLEPAPSSRSVTGGGVAIQTRGGVGAFTYSWARISGSTGMSISSSTTATPSFTATVLKNSTVSATWRCTVYDTFTGRSETIDRAINLSYSTNA